LAKTAKKVKHSAIATRKLRRNLAAISLIALLIKFFIILRIEGFNWLQAGNGDLGKGLGLLLDNNYAPPNAWYGADAENYLRGLQGLVQDGFFSEEGKLSYWPAGYPLLMWPLIELFRGYFFLVLAFLQSALYALGAIWFVDEIRKTRIAQHSYLVAFLLGFNPTLSFNTIAIGYELPVVALSLISVAALLRFFNEKRSGLISIELLVSSTAFAIATFIQPRLLVLAFAFFFIWALAKFRLKLIVPFMALSMGIVSLAPALMIYRNQEVHGYAAISTNLGVTMRLGAGPETSGGYSSQAAGLVDCPEAEGNPAEVDNAVVRCVIKWYVNNPATAAKLFWNKARFFWSPWFGPEANGTMARNPWGQNHPLLSTAQTQEGFDFIFGGVGKFISWTWMLTTLFLVLNGFRYLWKLRDLERLLGIMAGSSFALNLVSSMLTIGDHRFRIPSMGMSLLLQAIGFMALFQKRESRTSVTEPLVEWTSLKSSKSTQANS
jgi:hypothetical protein